jgi:uncharacterized protein DUF2380
LTARPNLHTRGSFALAAAFCAISIMLAPRSTIAAEPEPTKIAVFGFELQDVSASGGVIPPDANDIEILKQATERARRLMAASGRYSIVDAAGAAGSLQGRRIQDCNGCEAVAARQLGADQSLYGLVARVARVVYRVDVVIRDAKTGAVVSMHYTEGIGDTLSWLRAVDWLMANKLLVSERGATSQ